MFLEETLARRLFLGKALAGGHPPTSRAVTSVVLQARVLAGTPGTGPYTDFKVEVHVQSL